MRKANKLPMLNSDFLSPHFGTKYKKTIESISENTIWLVTIFDERKKNDMFAVGSFSVQCFKEILRFLIEIFCRVRGTATSLL